MWAWEAWPRWLDYCNLEHSPRLCPGVADHHQYVYLNTAVHCIMEPPLLLRLAQHGPLVSRRWMVVQTMHVVENTNVVQSLFRSTHTFHTLLMRPMSGDTRGKTCNDLRLGGGGGPKGCSLYLSWEQPWSVGSVGVGETALESLISWPLAQWPALHLPLTIRCLRWNYPRLLQNWAQRNSTAVDHLPDHFNRFKQDYGS